MDDIERLQGEVKALTRLLGAMAERMMKYERFLDLMARGDGIQGLILRGIMDAMRVYGIDYDEFIPPAEVIMGILSGDIETPADIPDYRHPDYEPGQQQAADVIDISTILDKLNFDDITPEDIIGDDTTGGGE